MRFPFTIQNTTAFNSLPFQVTGEERMVPRNRTSSTLIISLQLIVLVLSPKGNCLSLDDRTQLKQLTEEFVRKTNSIIFLIIHSNVN